MPICGNNSTNEPDIDAILAALSFNKLSKAIADLFDEMSAPRTGYSVAIPPNLIVCAPADAHSQVYVTLTFVLLEIVLPEAFVPDNVPPSPQST